jgi:hypothetical protein
VDGALLLAMSWCVYDRPQLFTAEDDEKKAYRYAKLAIEKGHLSHWSLAMAHRLVAWHAILSARQKHDAPKASLRTEAAAALDAAMKEGFPQPEELLITRAWLAEEIEGEGLEKAVEWARKAVHVADDRVELTKRALKGEIELPMRERLPDWAYLVTRLQPRKTLIAELLQLNKVDEAEGIAKEAFKLDSEDSDNKPRFSLEMIALVRFAQRRPKEAWELIEEGLKNSREKRDDALGETPVQRYVGWIAGGDPQLLRMLRLAPDAAELQKWVDAHSSRGSVK